jgi:hypothetical protein
VKDVTPPAISSIAADPDHLWPPNHKLVPVSLDVQVSDNCDDAPECEIISVESDEAVNGPGDGNTEPDWRITGKLSAELRAERDGRADGRVYTLHVKCTDDSGNESRSSALVLVPHDQGSNGGGRDPCKLKVSFDRVEKNRLVARLDVSAGDDGIPTDETHSRLDDLEGYQLTLGVGVGELQGVFSGEGLVATEHLRARWIPKRGILLVDIRDVDLPGMLGLDPDLEGKRILVDVPITVDVLSPAEGSQPILLFSETFSCTYRHKLPKGRRGGH